MTGRKRGRTVWATSALKATLKIAVAAGVVLLPLMLARAASAQSYSVLFNFSQTSGSFPLAGLIADPAGNLYGTAKNGGATDVALSMS